MTPTASLSRRCVWTATEPSRPWLVACHQPRPTTGCALACPQPPSKPPPEDTPLQHRTAV